MKKITINLNERANTQLNDLRHQRGDESVVETIKAALKVLNTVHTKADKFGFITVLYKGKEWRFHVCP